MPRARRWLRWSVLLVVGLAVGAVLSHRLLLPRLARDAIVGALGELGFPSASVRVESTSFYELHARDLQTGPGLVADHLDVSYTPATLWNSKVRSIAIRGARWTISARDGLDLGVMKNVKLGGNGQADGELPFDQVLLRDSAVLVEHTDGIAHVPIELTLDRRGASLNVSGRLEVEGQPVVIDGELGAGQRVELHAAGEVVAAGYAATKPRISLEHDQLDYTVEISAASLRFGDTTMTDPTAYLRLRLKTTDSGWAVELVEPATIDASAVMVDAGGSAIRAEQVALEIPAGDGPVLRLDSGDGWSLHAAFRLDAEHVDLPGTGVKLQDVVGKIHLTPRVLDAVVNWPIVSGGMLTAIAHFDLSSPTLRGQVHASLPAVRIDDPGALAQTFDALKGLDVTGAVAIDASASIEGARLDPQVTISLEDARLASARHDMAIDGVSGRVQLAGLDPIRTPAAQRLTVRRANSGKLALSDGELVFHVESASAVHVERARWSFGERGRFELSPFTIDPSNPTVQTRVSLADVGVGDLLALTGTQRVRGEGAVSGSVEVSYQPGSPLPIRLGEGEIAADANGWFQVPDRAAVEGMVSEAEALGPEVRGMLVDALTDFQYSELRLQFVRENGASLVRLRASGKGRAGPEPLEIGSLTINIRGDVNEAVSQWLSPPRGSGQAVDNALERALGR